MNSRTRIKICGLRQEADVDAAVRAGADAVGFVFYAASPRNIELTQAVELARRLPPFVTPVGLFVNAEPAFIERALEAIPGLLPQFHGDETAADCERIQRRYLRAVPVKPDLDLLRFASQHPQALGLLLDAPVEGYGGGGKVFDWSLVPLNVRLPVVLSGGLHARNVIEAIRQVHPWAVDVSSGVESSRGVKDAQAIQRFCEAVRGADARLADSPT
jgi:phosphoribosylanthranilate isomerase